MAHSGRKAPDDGRQQPAERVVKHLEASGFELDVGNKLNQALVRIAEEMRAR